MASSASSLVRLRALASTTSSHTPPLRLPRALPRPTSNSSPRTVPRPSPFVRAVSQTTFLAQRLGPRPNPNLVDYDASLGDPWFHYRLRTAKPLTPARAPPAPPAPERPKPARAPGPLRRFLRATRTRTVAGAALLGAALFYWSNIEVVPVSGRRRFNCCPEAAVRALGRVRFALLRRGAAGGAAFLPAHDARVRQVRRVLARLAAAAGLERDARAACQVFVLDDRDRDRRAGAARANAFVLAGGQVVVRSGLLRVARTDGQVAAVLSHEIAHSLARHVAERLSAAVGESALLGSALLLAPATPCAALAGWVLGRRALGLLFSRPRGRMQESEADYIGLMIMAEACYDPREALVFWSRVVKIREEAERNVPEWISTHPSSEHRLARFHEWLPEALERRDRSDCAGTSRFVESFRRAMERNEVLVRAV